MTSNYSKGVTHCSECGCPCQNCSSSGGFAFQQEEIEKLRNLARNQQASISRLEAQLQAETEARSKDQHRLQEELCRLRDRYDRLLESHKKLGRLNSSLEERLLGMAERLSESESRQADSRQRLDEADAAAAAARQEADRCRADCALAVQLLQSQPPAAFLSNCAAAASSAAAVANLPPSSTSFGAPAAPSASVSVPLPTFPPTFAHMPPPPPPQRQQQQSRHFLLPGHAAAANTGETSRSSSEVLHL
ncbi:hypothetical protein BOX15_Mlig009990g2 [Macrostomum lignano]|uniref:Uncharacterized protein n=1 Tax=Macrostomum lignano TaxID=282301 RepID=A0A267DPN2_9PLAT|nr:hypothetical protein BOX15_Mlig009990g2 [Macrostomum lignano]